MIVQLVGGLAENLVSGFCNLFLILGGLPFSEVWQDFWNIPGFEGMFFHAVHVGMSMACGTMIFEGWVTYFATGSKLRVL